MALGAWLTLCLGGVLAAEPEPPHTVKVLVVNFDPVVPEMEGKTVREIFKWHDVHDLVKRYNQDLFDCSGGYARYEVVEWIDVPTMPIAKSGARYNPAEFVADWKVRKTKLDQDEFDFGKFLSDGNAYPFNRPLTIAERVAAGTIDEIFIFMGPCYLQMWEASMAGPDPFFINGAVFLWPATGRNVPIMGFNYERDTDCMLEDFCHRTECTMTRVYQPKDFWFPTVPLTNHWDRFRMFDKIAAGEAACGICHFAPSSQSDYDWGNQAEVWSTCDDWLNNWPNLTGAKRKVTCAEWGGGEMRLHHVWWLRHLPQKPGINPDGKQNNWWKYVIDHEHYGPPPV